MADSSRFQRVVSRLLSRLHSHRDLRQASSPEQARALAGRRPIQFFNGNALRAKIVQGVVDLAKCDLFAETGTSHAATAIGAHRFLGLPVRSCEISRKDYLVSRLMTFGISRISLSNADSRAFLPQVVTAVLACNLTPFFYLDAHEGALDRTSLPLREELGTILTLPRPIVLIDDVRVPQRDGFLWGNYGGKSLEINLIRDLLLSADIQSCYFPAYAPAQETGHPSGYCLFWRCNALDDAVTRALFPFDLLRAYSLKAGDYVSTSDVAAAGIK